jgi:hypothetical protein
MVGQRVLRECLRDPEITEVLEGADINAASA